MTHNTRDIEEGVDAVFQAVMSDLKQKYRVSDTLSNVLSDSLSGHLTTAITTLHQELQKARHYWLREEIVKLEALKLPEVKADDAEWVCFECGYFHEDNTEHNNVIQTIIDRYLSELDQLTK